MEENKQEEEKEDNTKCYCNEEKEWTSTLCCDVCKKLFHFECLKSGSPTLLAGDVYFNFTCADCAENNEEQCTRKNLSWLQAVYLSMYNLHLSGKGRKGFFRWKEDICTFIKTNWTTLFPADRKPTANWPSTVAGVLSVNCPRFFTSGHQEIKENGWWALKHCSPPIEKLSEPVVGAKKRGATGYRSTKRRRHLASHSAESSSKVSKQSYTQQKPESQQNNTAELASEISIESLFTDYSDPLFESLSDHMFSSFFTDVLPPDHGEINVVDDDLQLLPDILELNDVPEKKSSDVEDECDDNESVQSEKAESITTQSDISSSADSATRDSTIKLTKQKTLNKKVETIPENKIVPLQAHQEKELLYQLNELPQVLHHDPAARRLRRKLIIRQIKRDRGLPVFDLDKFMSSAVETTSHYEVTKTGEIEPVKIVSNDDEVHKNDEMNKSEETAQDKALVKTKSFTSIQTSLVASRDSCVLDRFQVPFNHLPSIQQQPKSFLHRLIGGGSTTLHQPIISPYTARKLKPFIRRDHETRPLKLNLLQEIIAYPHRNDPNWIPPPVSPIDYCYVLPHHIPSVNAMCREFFWPGIDLSECLKYPDFSCVVLYKKFVIGFAFMVPDVKYNEAYISFILVHPDWRRAGICTFMLYHLIQTCMGKDVTLHVSATNSAMLLYQKFCFKPEELILDFYSKYLPETSIECRHAYFLRLRR